MPPPSPASISLALPRKLTSLATERRRTSSLLSLVKDRQAAAAAALRGEGGRAGGVGFGLAEARLDRWACACRRGWCRCFWRSMEQNSALNPEPFGPTTNLLLESYCLLLSCPIMYCTRSTSLAPAACTRLLHSYIDHGGSAKRSRSSWNGPCSLLGSCIGSLQRNAGCCRDVPGARSHTVPCP